MSFTAYWKTTTGFNVSDYPVTIGKQLNQCTSEELLAHPMCGSVSLFANIAYMVKSTDLGYSNVAMNLTGGAQWKEPIIGNKSNTWVCEEANSGDNAKIYRRTIFIAWKTNVTMPQYSIDDTCDNNIYIVDNITSPNKLVYNTTGQSDLGHGDGASISARLGAFALKHTCQKGQSAWSNAPNQVVYEDPDTHVITNYNIGLVFAYVVGSEVFLCCKDHLGAFGGRYQNDSNRYNFLSDGNNYKSFKSADNYRLFLGQNVNGLNREATLGEIWPNCYPDPIPVPAVFVNSNQYYAKPTTILPYNLEFKYTMNNSTIGGFMASRGLYVSLSAITALEARKQQIARAGVYFVHDGELLKPVVENGIVINYATPEQPSEIDTYTDLNHPVPTTPDGGGGGGGDEDSEDDEITPNEFGIDSYTGGVATYYLMTPQELKDLITDFYTRAEPGMTFGNNIISLFACVDAIPDLVGVDPHPITIHNSAQDTPFVSLAEYNEIVAIVNPTLGTKTVPRKNNCFLDFSPYTNYEVFVPTIGWLSLPDTVAGREIEIKYYIDITTCRATAIVSIDGVVMAQGSGTVGAAVPLAIIETGLLAGANIQSAAAVFSSALQAGGGFGSGNIGFGLSGIGNLAQNAAQLVVDGNTNYTMVKGSGGDASTFGAGHLCQLKITHPVSIVRPDKEPMNVPNFGHTVGYLCYVTGTLNTFSGFTVCYNPHVNINCTNVEREEIKQLLESGVIL